MKKKSITVPAPINLQKDESHLYEPYLTFKRPIQKVKYLKNVFITHSGLCLNRNGLIKESHHDYPSQYFDYLNEASTNYHAALDNLANLIVLNDDNVYLVIHHPWYNYFHWVTESIFRLWMVHKKLDKFILVLPDYYQRAEFITESLRPFNIKKIFFIPAGKSLLVRNACLPQIKPICDSYNPYHVKRVREFYRNYILENGRITKKNVERLYVSRRLAGRRQIVNESDILKILKKYHFTIFHPEKHSFLEQVAFFSQVKYIVGTHGSGLTNMLFMDKNCSLLELHKNKTNELNHPSFLFWYMAHILGIKYFHQSCETFGIEDYFEGDYIVDVDLFENNLIHMLNN